MLAFAISGLVWFVWAKISFTKRTDVCCLVFLFVCVSPLVAERAKHPVTLDDLATLKQLEDIRISPNGNFLVYATEDGDLWMVATLPGSVPERLGKGVLPIWSPNGERLAYYSGESSTFQLWVRDVASGRAEPVTKMEGGVSPDPYTRMGGFTHDPLLYSWSPDGTRLVFASRLKLKGNVSVSEAAVEMGPSGNEYGPLILTTLSPPEWTLSGIFRAGGFGVPEFANGTIDWATHSTSADAPTVNQLFIVDIHTKETVQLPHDESIYFNPDGAPDGRTIVCVSSEGRSLLGNGSGTTNIYALDVSTGQKTALTHGSGDKRMPSWSPDGNWIGYLGAEHFDRQFVDVIPSGGGKPTNITLALQRDVVNFQWGLDSKSVIVVYQDGISWPVSRVYLQDHKFRAIGDGKPMRRLYLNASRSGAVAWEESDPTSTGVIRFLSNGAQVPIPLIDLNPQIKEWDLGDQEVVH